MSLPIHSLPLADVFDSLRIQLSEGLVNWLTPVWILCVGAAAGLLLCAAVWGLLRLISLIPGVATLTDRREGRYVGMGILAIVLFGLALAAFPSLRGVQPGEAAEAGRQLDAIWAWGGTLVTALLLACAVVHLLRRNALAETGVAIREGVLWPLTIAAVVMSVMAVVGMFVVRSPMEMLGTLNRAAVLARQGDVTLTQELPPPATQFDEPEEVVVPISIRKDEIRQVTVSSDQRVKLRTESFAAQSPVAVTLDVPAGEEQVWRRDLQGTNPFRDEIVDKLYAKNYGSAAAQLRVTAVRSIAYPQMMLVPMMAVSMAGVFFLYLFQRAATPKLAAIALSTAKSEMAQPLYAIITALGIFLLIVFIYVPYFTLASDIKMLKDSGLSLILVLAIIQAVWAASTSVADEVEGKTALTVLSKPVSRRDFILGKFAGIGWSVGLMIVMLGLLMLVTVAYKPIYDAREGGYTIQQAMQFQTDPTWQNCFGEMVQIIPGLVLAFLEMLVMASLSVAISTRLPALANFIISFSIYVLGHLTPLMVQSQVVAEQLPPVVFFGRLIATVLPVLDHFNVQASVAAGVDVPLHYLAWALVYCTLYSAIAMLLALTLFEDRDLA